MIDITLKNFLNEKDIEFIEDADLSEYSNTKTGGNCFALISPKNTDQLIATLKILREAGVTFFVLGDMTDVAIASGKLDFAVISMSHFSNGIRFDQTSKQVSVDAGVKMKDLAVWAYKNSVAGLQWMEGIPGTVGAGAYMNAGFLPGQDFQNTLLEATVLMPDLSIQTYKNKDLQYAYRKSIIQKIGGIIIRVKLLVRSGKKWKIGLRMLQYHRRRARHQPLAFPSAGTVFIPPVPYHLGGMLPQLKMKGYRIGGAKISEKSPGFIVGVDHMTGEDYYALVRLIQKEVKNKFDVELEPEVRLIGFEDQQENNKDE